MIALLQCNQIPSYSCALPVNLDKYTFAGHGLAVAQRCIAIFMAIVTIAHSTCGDLGNLLHKLIYCSRAEWATLIETAAIKAEVVLAHKIYSYESGDGHS